LIESCDLAAVELQKQSWQRGSAVCLLVQKFDESDELMNRHEMADLVVLSQEFRCVGRAIEYGRSCHRVLLV
jgi:hypothetical protein